VLLPIPTASSISLDRGSRWTKTWFFNNLNTQYDASARHTLLSLVSARRAPAKAEEEIELPATAEHAGRVSNALSGRRTLKLLIGGLLAYIQRTRELVSHIYWPPLPTSTTTRSLPARRSPRPISSHPLALIPTQNVKGFGCFLLHIKLPLHRSFTSSSPHQGRRPW
jgi:hypothetical protein